MQLNTKRTLRVLRRCPAFELDKKKEKKEKENNPGSEGGIDCCRIEVGTKRSRTNSCYLITSAKGHSFLMAEKTYHKSEGAGCCMCHALWVQGWTSPLFLLIIPDEDGSGDKCCKRTRAPVVVISNMQQLICAINELRNCVIL